MGAYNYGARINIITPRELELQVLQDFTTPLLNKVLQTIEDKMSIIRHDVLSAMASGRSVTL